MKVAVDIVILTIQESVLKVLLVKRRIPPFMDQFAIPADLFFQKKVSTKLPFANCGRKLVI